MQARNRHWRARARRQAGITLLEILIVLAILGLIFGIFVAPRLFGALDEAQEDAAYLEAGELVKDAKHYRLKTGKRCPDSIDAVLKFAEKDGKKDPWDSPYVLVCGEQAKSKNIPGGVGVYSLGPDKKDGTEDDIKSWDKKKKS